jgi:hypothetical protein
MSFVNCLFEYFFGQGIIFNLKEFRALNRTREI